MESMLAFLYWFAFGCIFVSIIGLVLAGRARVRHREASVKQRPGRGKRSTLRDALGGLADAIGSLF